MDDKAPTICIVGSGAAGLAAAVAAAEATRSETVPCRIVLIDRAPQGEHGGNTRFSPSYMRMASMRAVAPGFENDLLASSGGRMDRGYIRRLAADAPPTIAWLMGHGVAFDKPVYYLSAGPPRIQPRGGGAAVLHALEDAARAAGVAMRYGVRAERLRTTPGGAVAGIEVRFADGTVGTVDASVVVLTTGGFAGNSEMLAKHMGPAGEGMAPISPGTRFNTGDGIRMALAAGAQASGDWRGMHCEPIDPRSGKPAPVVLVYPYGLVIDGSGQRFCDEGAGLVHETWEVFARAIQFETPDCIAYAILDARLLDIPGYERAIRSEVPPFQAESLAELAALIGVPADALQTTVARHNRAATGDPKKFDASRLDGLASAEGFSPPKSNWCRSIERPPYLAYPLIGAIAYTFGGLATNADGQVLGTNGPIPGLFAAGEITGHFYGTAPNAVAMLRALVFGRITGAVAANFAAGTV